MNVLILGSGGREHALAYKISQSPLLNKLYILPGNAGTESLGKNLNLQSDFATIARKCIDFRIDMLVVGPEAMLVKGIKDYFQRIVSLKHIKVVGPDKAAAQLEGSKAFAKKFMNTYHIPTAGYFAVNKKNKDKGLRFLDQQKPPFVLKADGLAAGKGVIICENKEQAATNLEEILSGKFGKAGKTVLIEEFLQGIEMSVFILTDGKSYAMLPNAKDYKRIGEKDTGLNTGGMGAVSPVPFANNTLMDKIKERIVEPTIQGIKENNMTYEGVLYFGLMIVDNEPYVIEYNVRMGDPEAEAVVPRIKSDLLEHLNAACTNSLDKEIIKIDQRTAATVILASGGYPEKYEKGKIITGIDKVKSTMVFHAGTKKENNNIVTNGGRVMALTSFGKKHKKALKRSYAAAKKINFDKKYYRKDIGFDL
ncbi:MAG: phosphoribosylamine--glycine ligase [Bacteroidota bacterium]|nr:phosphoribosylamine--glycine ligase [Bacteroidota bacterium]